MASHHAGSDATGAARDAAVTVATAVHAALIDLDGTILGTKDEERSLGGLRLFVKRGWKVAIITNQPPREDATDIAAARMMLDLSCGPGVTLAWYVCPHTRDEGCACRKPKPGLLLQAMKDLGAVCANTWMIGDKWSDMLAGQRAGVHTCLVEEFGYRQKGETAVDPPDLYCTDLLLAARVLTCLHG